MNWTPITGLSFYNTITFFSEPSKLWAGTIAGVWLSTDNGITWEDRSNGLSPDPYGSSIIRVNGVLLTALKFGGSGVYRTFDDGMNWENISDGLPFLNLISRLLEYNGNILAATSDGLWQRDLLQIPVELVSFTASANRNSVELKWKTATEKNNSGFEIQRRRNGDYWTDLTFIRGKGTTTEPGEYFYSDKDISEGSYSYRLKQIDYNGVYEYSRIVEVDYSSPVQYSLEQNYPNPFNPSSTIAFSIGETSSVTIRVYNSVGGEVCVLINEQKPAGNYTLNFNGNGLASGVYYYKLTAGNFNAIRKMVLLR
jgi:hypothetical protein